MWVLPFAARPIAEATAVSLAPLVLLAAFGLILRRAGVLEGVRPLAHAIAARLSRQRPGV